MSARYVAAVLAAAALAFATLVSAPVAQAGTGDNKIRIVQHNTDEKGFGAALNQVDGDVDALTLQELCEAEANQLRNRGWKVHWKPQRMQADGCPAVDGRRQKGNAVATKHSFGGKNWTSLGVYEAGTGNERRFKLVCAEIVGAGVPNTWVCTAHLALGYPSAPDGPANRLNQVTTITDTLNPWVTNGRRVILAGDFNAPPDSPEMGLLYRVQSGGNDRDKFWEGDQGDPRWCPNGPCRDMQGTTDDGKRIDYFFASYRGVNRASGMDKQVTKLADRHAVIKGEVVFKPLG